MNARQNGTKDVLLKVYSYLQMIASGAAKNALTTLLEEENLNVGSGE